MASCTPVRDRAGGAHRLRAPSLRLARSFRIGIEHFVLNADEASLTTAPRERPMSPRWREPARVARRLCRRRARSFILKRAFQSVGLRIPAVGPSRGFPADSFANKMEPMLPLHVVDPSGSVSRRS